MGIVPRPDLPIGLDDDKCLVSKVGVTEPGVSALPKSTRLIVVHPASGPLRTESRRGPPIRL